MTCPYCFGDCGKRAFIYNGVLIVGFRCLGECRTFFVSDALREYALGLDSFPATIRLARGY